MNGQLTAFQGIYGDIPALLQALADHPVQTLAAALHTADTDACSGLARQLTATVGHHRDELVIDIGAPTTTVRSTTVPLAWHPKDPDTGLPTFTGALRLERTARRFALATLSGVTSTAPDAVRGGAGAQPRAGQVAELLATLAAGLHHLPARPDERSQATRTERDLRWSSAASGPEVEVCGRRHDSTPDHGRIRSEQVGGEIWPAGMNMDDRDLPSVDARALLARARRGRVRRCHRICRHRSVRGDHRG